VVFVDAADELCEVQEHSLRRAMNTTPEGEPITWVLGVLPGSPLLAELTGPYQVLRLPSHLALEGANR
jgi:hypothetical protein